MMLILTLVDIQMYVHMMIGMDWLKKYIVALNYVRNVDPAPNRWSHLSINHFRVYEKICKEFVCGKQLFRLLERSSGLEKGKLGKFG